MTQEHRLAHRGGEDPPGYAITAVPGGWTWTRRADGWTSPPHPTRADAVTAALADGHGGQPPGPGDTA